MDYSKRTDNKESFRLNVFKLFTDVCGGDSQELVDHLYSKFIVEDFAYGDDLYYFGIEGFFKNVVIPHKIAVFKAGLALTTNPSFNSLLSSQEKECFLKNLWLHDLSKFSANEAFGYAMYNRETGYGKEEFELAWHHHKMNNPHHPEYWLNPNRSGEIEPLAMPNIYVLEMIADWIGAGKTYGNSLEDWLPKNIGKFKFKNRAKVAEIIRDFTGIMVVMENNSLIVEVIDNSPVLS